MSSLSDRLSAGERPRDLQSVSLLLVDGTEVQGVLHRAPGTRTLDYLNHQTESFVAMTRALLLKNGRTDSVEFIAINKQHIIRLVEAAD